MRIRFLETRTVQAADGETYSAGETYDLPEASAHRWIHRGVAVAAPDRDVAAGDRSLLDPPGPGKAAGVSLERPPRRTRRK